MTDTPFKSVLVANRGEIALRIMRTARRMGIRSIAVYTDADAGAPHVEYADQAIRIGEGPVTDSYLSIDKILAAASDAGAEVIHPGYGFLSESAEFATAVSAAGLVFVGPSAKAIGAMGNKAAAKRLMIAAGVPCVPGYEGADQNDAAFVQAAKDIGFPVMIKAAAGGGGRGMRLVSTAGELSAALGLARSEAASSFGSDELILEAAIQRPRHVEVQVFADRTGACVHLGERDCSVQRRHQKVIEETPSPAVSPDLRSEMGAAAIRAAQSVGYEGAGTVEFLLDNQGAFYFLEMNTRLQVEHPVTEMVTGLDLVEMQFQVALGLPILLKQSDVKMRGHAIEVRLYGEDPANDFLPCSGRVAHWHAPTGEGIRVDAGIQTGQEVPAFYDPMLAKIVAHGSTRNEARIRLIEALKSTALFGVKTNRDFLIELMETNGFADGSATTAFIQEIYGPDGPTENSPEFSDIALAASLYYRETQGKRAEGCPTELLGWGSAGSLKSRLRLLVGDAEIVLRLEQARDGVLTLRSGENLARARWQGDGFWLNDQKRAVTAFLHEDATLYLAENSKTFAIKTNLSGEQDRHGGDGPNLTAPMHGNLVEIFVKAGDKVAKGTHLAILEAMKLQHELLAGADGTVCSVHVSKGQQVRANDLLIEIEPGDGK